MRSSLKNIKGKLLLMLALLCIAVFSNAQTCVSLSSTPSSAQNYIVSYTPRVSGITDPTTLPAKNTCQVMQTIKYFDGLGRLVQTVQTKGNPGASKDVIAPVAYDGYGRTITSYMPYTASGTSGSYRATSFADQATFYSGTSGVVTTTKPYSQSFVEFSPLNRPVEDGAPGADWQPGAGHSQRISYTFNNHTAFNSNTTSNNPGSRKVLYYTVTNNTDGTRTLNLPGTTLYNDNDLDVTIAKDENWTATDGCLNTTETYKDKEGHVVLKRTYNYNAVTAKTEMLSTYYVYDDLGNLCFVLPPLSKPDAGTSVDLGNLCYEYIYDERNRLTQKKIPSKDWEYIVYNQLDQPVLSQDGIQRATNQWTVTKYDGQGRVIMTGLWNAGSAIPLATLQANIYAGTQWDARDNTNVTTGYNISSYPTLSKTLTINYYDDYTGIPSFPAAYAATATSTTMTRGLLTVTKTAVLNTINNATPDMLWAVHYYDVLGRDIQSYQQHYLGGTAALNTNNYDAATQYYDFTNAPTSTKRQHYKSGTLVVTVNTRNIYDHMGRKLKHWESIQNAGQTADTRTLIDKIDYNEIGQLLTRHLHSTDSVNFLQNIAYTYNERGWMLSNSAALFAEQLQYNTSVAHNGLTPVPQYNGNISAQSWGPPTSPDFAKTYVYGYDKQNRLTSGTSSDNYNESGISYDMNGNITALNRTTGSTVYTDQLTYTYSGNNKLQSVNDVSGSDIGQKSGTTSYTYDKNGNLLTDPGKGITTNIVYNMLNLPQSISNKSTTYTYDANGQKLQRTIGTAVTDYINGIQYDGTSGSSTITFIQTEEGRAIPNGATAYNYEYFLTDHLGNSRIAFDTKTGAAVQVQQDDYYPFGMEILRTSPVPTLKNEYLYNGKELQENIGLYDYGARLYDPVLGRWTSVDPLAEINRRFSPFNYVENNPIRMIDPDGMNGEQDNVANTTDVGVAGTGEQVNDPSLISNIFSKYVKPLIQKAKKQKAKEDAEKAKRLRMAPHLKKLTDWWEILAADLNGGRDYDGFNYDNDGNAVGIAVHKLEVPWYVTGPGEVVEASKFWGFWEDYEKVVVNGKEYAKIGERLFTQHAVERMLPSGLGQAAGGAVGRSIAPEFVEYVIKEGATANYYVDGVLRTDHILGTVHVVTENAGKIVVTVITK